MPWPLAPLPPASAPAPLAPLAAAAAAAAALLDGVLPPVATTSAVLLAALPTSMPCAARNVSVDVVPVSRFYAKCGRMAVTLRAEARRAAAMRRRSSTMCSWTGRARDCTI
jgi:hypothetical protein